MAVLEEDKFSKNLDYLFEKKVKYETKIVIRVRCDECFYSETREDLPDGYFHCKYYPNMICRKDDSCRAGKKIK